MIKLPWFILMALACAGFWGALIWWLFRIPGRMVLA